MKKISFAIVLSLLVIVIQNSYAQSDNELLPNTRGILYLENGDVFNFNKIEPTDEGFTYWLEENNQVNDISKAKVYEIKQYVGSFAGEGAAGGMLGGLLGSFIGTLSWNEESGLADAKVPFIIGGTIGGGLIGAIIGAKQKKVKTVYSKAEDQVYVMPTINIDKMACNDKLSYGIGIRLVFR